jgi:hypothetical protein
MQPYLFPYIGYFQLINAVDRVVRLDSVAFNHRGWITRNRIVLNGREHMIGVPLEKASQNRMIRDIMVVADAGWKTKLLKTIYYGYHKCRHFGEVYPLVESILAFGEMHISGLVRRSIEAINAYLGISTTIVPTSSGYNNDHLHAAEKIIDICRQEGATQYVNPIGGADLYDKEQFREHAIELKFLKTKQLRYPQAADIFIPNLSIIDVLMNTSGADMPGLLAQYELL